MDSQTVFQIAFDFCTSKPIVVEPSAAQVSSDGGLLPFRELDEQIGLTRQFAEALIDRRHAGYVGHTFLDGNVLVIGPVDRFEWGLLLWCDAIVW